MALDLTTVDKIAHLARLSLTEAERTKYSHDLGQILDIMTAINNVDTDQIKPMAHSVDMSQRCREDQVEAVTVDLQKRFQQNAPTMEANLYLVPKVIE